MKRNNILICAMLIGIAPIINIGLIALLLFFSTAFNDFAIWTGYPAWVTRIRIYLILCFGYFALPDFGDLTLPFAVAAAKQTEIIFLLTV